MSPNNVDRLREYDRHMLRSAFASLFWSAIKSRRQRGKFTLQSLADGMGINKSAVSRWFSSNTPNWRIDTIADIARVLDLELHVSAMERQTGLIHTPQGIQAVSTETRPNGTSAEVPTTRTDVLAGGHTDTRVSVS